MPDTPPGSAACICAEILRGGEQPRPCPAHGWQGDPPDTAAWPLFSHGRRWFRVKGYGVRYVDHRRHPMFFSERNGYRRGLHVGPHCLMVVKP